MRAVLASRQPTSAMDELLTFVGDDPAAVEGARKAFWRVMESKSRRGGETTVDAAGRQPWMPKAWQGFLDENAPVLERLYRDDPEHLEHLRGIASVLQGVDLRSRAKAPNTSGTAQGLSGGHSPALSMETLSSRAMAVHRGQIGLPYFGLSIAATAARRIVGKAREETFSRLLDRALLNPEIAAALLKENNPANRAAMRRRAKLWLGNEALTFLDLLDDEEEDPIKGAIMRKTG